MASVAWPISLPVYSKFGWTQPPSDSTLRTKSDQGPSKRRNRYTGAPVIFRGTFVMTAAQAATFTTFFETTTQQGVLAFDFTDHSDDVIKDYAFADTPQKIETHPGLFSVSVELERQV